MRQIKSSKILLLISFLLPGALLFAQDPTFSQFDANQLYYNPAYTGYKKNSRIALSYRNLWPNVPGKGFPGGPSATYSIFGDTYFSIKDRFTAGAGAFVMQNAEGDGYLTTTSAGLLYSQHMPRIKSKTDLTDRFNIYLGFKVYYNNIHVDPSRFVFSDQLDVNYGISGPSSFNQSNIISRNYFDFDFGLLVRNNFRGKDKWYNELGFAMAHVLSPAISITGSNSDPARLPRRYIATYRSSIALKGGSFYIGPSVLFENQGRFYAMNAGLDFFLRFSSSREVIPLSISLYNRFSFIVKNNETGQQKINTSALILSVNHKGTFTGGKYSTGYYVGFSVDFPYMGLGMQTAGAYELAAGIIIPRKRNNSVIYCPFENI